eukprot:1658145-Rhodomonas_salina.4
MGHGTWAMHMGRVARPWGGSTIKSPLHPLQNSVRPRTNTRTCFTDRAKLLQGLVLCLQHKGYLDGVVPSLDLAFCLEKPARRDSH